jgi:hypothetical protein
MTRAARCGTIVFMNGATRGCGGFAAMAFPFLCGCGGAQAAPKPPPSTPSAVDSAATAAPSTQPVETGKDCATAEGKCGGGVCDVTVKNGCSQAIRCELEVAATCESQSGTAESGGRERDTFAAGASGDLGAKATCADGRVVRTEVRQLSCK